MDYSFLDDGRRLKFRCTKLIVWTFRKVDTIAAGSGLNDIKLNGSVLTVVFK